MIDETKIKIMQDYIRQHNLSNREFAAIVGLSPTSVSGWLNRTTGIRPNNWRQIKSKITEADVNLPTHNAIAPNTDNTKLRDLQSDIMLDDDIPANLKAKIYKKIQTKITDG